jgi:hypothetical protein
MADQSNRTGDTVRKNVGNPLREIDRETSSCVDYDAIKREARNMVGNFERPQDLLQEI